MSHHLFDSPETLYSRRGQTIVPKRRVGDTLVSPHQRNASELASNDDSDPFALFRGVVNALWMGVALWLVIAALGVWALDIATGANTFADLRAWAGL